MKNIIKTVIEQGNYDLGALLGRINRYHVEGVLTDADRDELITLAREHANIRGNVDVFAKLEELDRRLTALENGEASSPAVGDTPQEYVAGKWYYRGNKVTFDGAVYECAAPEGAVCTWSPSEYPAYWTNVA